MSNEDDSDIIDDEGETNKDHEYQGKFRKGILDLDVIEYGIKRDRVLRDQLTMNNLVITCIDHLRRFRCISSNEILTFDNKYSFMNFIWNRLFTCGISIKKVMFSEGPKSNSIYNLQQTKINISGEYV